MPHIVIEYAQDLVPEPALEQLLGAVHQAVNDTALFAVDNIKTRLHPVRHYRLAAGYAGFIAVQCRIHTGRDVSQRQALSQAILDAVLPHCPAATVVTVEVVEMDRSSYRKAVV